MDRAAARLPKDSNHERYPCGGLIAPLSAVRTLGSDAAFYARFVQEGVCFSLAILILLFPIILINMGLGAERDYNATYTQFIKAGKLTSLEPDGVWTEKANWPNCSIYAGYDFGNGAPLMWGVVGGNGELAGAQSLTWWHVVFDSLSMLLFVIMLVRMQRRMLRDGYVFAQVAREMRAATKKVEEEVMHVAEIAGETAKAGLGAAKTAADCVVHTAAAVAAAAHIPDAVNNFGAAATHKVEDVIHVVSDKGTQATQAALSQTRKATLKATRAAKSAASHLVPEWWQHYIESALEAMPPPREWWKNPESSPVRVDMAAAACTLVLHGWDQDAESSKKGCVPDDALARLIAAAGERPLAVNHARNVEPLTEVWDDLNEKVVERDRLPQPGPDGAVTEEMAKAIAEVKALERIVNAYQDDADVLPLVFVTFNSSKVAQRAASEASAELHNEFGVSIGSAPRPTDIVWEHLHASPKEDWRHCSRVLYIVVVALVMGPAIAVAIMIATAFAMMALPWVPFNWFFSGWLPAQKVIGGLHWLWGVFMYITIYGVLNSLITLTMSPADAGWCPARLRPRAIRDYYHSTTSGHMHLVNTVALVEVFALIIGNLLMFIPIFGGTMYLATWACNWSCLCWWINPNLRDLGSEWDQYGEKMGQLGRYTSWFAYAEGSWYDFGAGFAFNTLVNAFIGDALFSSFVGPFIGRIVARFAARSEPTQSLMDEKCRSRDPAYLPHRIVHLIKAWFYAVGLSALVPFATMPLVVYHVVSYCTDRYNILCALEPLPPSSGLCMRHAVTILLPFAVPMHFVMGIIGYTSTATHGSVNPTVKYLQPEYNWHVLWTYVVIAFIINIYLFTEIFYLQRREAIRRGLMTPFEVLKAAFLHDNAFRYAAASEPYRFVDVRLDDLGIGSEAVKSMYRPDVMRRSAESWVEEWEGAELDSLPSGGSVTAFLGEISHAWELPTSDDEVSERSTKSLKESSTTRGRRVHHHAGDEMQQVVNMNRACARELSSRRLTLNRPERSESEESVGRKAKKSAADFLSRLRKKKEHIPALVASGALPIEMLQAEENAAKVAKAKSKKKVRMPSRGKSITEVIGPASSSSSAPAHAPTAVSDNC